MLANHRPSEPDPLGSPSLQLALGDDLVCRLEGLPAGLRQRVVHRFAAFLGSSPAAPRVVLSIDAREPPEGLAEAPVIASRPPLTVRRRQRVLHYEVPGAEGWCDCRAGRGGLSVSSTATVAELDAVAAMALPSMLFELAARHGWLGIHAAGLTLDGGGLLLPGASGVGKTTLSELARRGGIDVLSDDLVWLQERPEGGFALWAGPAAGALPDTALSDTALPDNVPKADGVPLVAIACPAISSRPHSRLVALALPEVLETLLAQCSFLADGPEAGERFRRLGRAAGSVPGYRLQAARDEGQILQFLRALLRTGRPPTAAPERPPSSVAAPAAERHRPAAAEPATTRPRASR